MRSTIASATGGVVSGFSFLLAAVDHTYLELRAALVTLLTAAAVALADWLVHRKRAAAERDRFLRHRQNRRAVRRKPRSADEGAVK